MTDPQQTFAAGWHADVNAPGTERWYDGTAWTQHVQHTTPQVTVVPPPVAAPSIAPAGTVDPVVERVASASSSAPRRIIGLLAVLAVVAVAGLVYTVMSGDDAASTTPSTNPVAGARERQTGGQRRGELLNRESRWFVRRV